MQEEVPYSKAVVSKYPEQVVVAIARDDSGRYNPITLGWTMIVSHDPPMMAIAVGLERYSLGVIRSAREFVIAFPSDRQVPDVMLFGTKSGRDVDKLPLSGATTQPATQIDCVLLADAVANFECKLAADVETGDHVVLVGQVVCSHINPIKLDRLYTVGSGYKMSGLARVE